MPFRLERSWFNASARTLALAGTAFLFSHSVFATLSVTPVNLGGADGLNNIYYAGNGWNTNNPAALAGTAFLDPAITSNPFVNYTAGSIGGGTDTNQGNLLIFQIVSDVAISAQPNQEIAVGAFLSSATTTASGAIGNRAIPLVGAGVTSPPGSCASVAGACAGNYDSGSGGPTPTPSTGNFRVALISSIAANVPYFISFYVNDACVAYGNTGTPNASVTPTVPYTPGESAAPLFCSTTASGGPPALTTIGTVPLPANSGLQVPVTFFMTPVVVFFNGTTITSAGALPDPTALPDLTNATNIQVVNLIYQNFSLPAATCNGPSLYFPGDGQIFIDSTQVSPGVGPALPGTTAAPAARAITLIAVASPSSGAPINLTPTYASASNPPSNSVGFGGSLNLSGFTNSSAVSGVGSSPYDVDLMERDAAGIVVPPPSGSSCSLTNVETASIQTFLSNNKCFIATAAFQSMDSAPILLLRKFRDDFLLHFSAGQAFVRWYYAWSPAAADWIIENPFFRLPVLSALIPLEILAYLILHPALLLGGVTILAALAVILFRLNTRLSRA